MNPASFRLALVTSSAMLAFAANSLLCRLALRQTTIDAATFTTIRLCAAALTLIILVQVRHRADANGARRAAFAIPGATTWAAALALLVYAWAFSFAYVGLSAGTGALLLFGAVQLTMVVSGWLAGERLGARPIAGFVLACAGLVTLLLPGLSAPPLAQALLMLAAGVAWGLYSLLGRKVTDPVASTARNFLLAAPASIVLGLVVPTPFSIDPMGATCAALSGALASAVGYVVWYAALRRLTSMSAAAVQLTVPALAAIGGILFLDESFTLRLAVCCVAILGGIAVMFLRKPATA